MQKIQSTDRQVKIIADTNIWYYLAQNRCLFNKVKHEPISPTFVNIYELSKSENLIDKEELSRPAIQKLFHYKENVIYEPPFVYIAQQNCKYHFDVAKELGGVLEFTSKIAKGYSIDKARKDEFKTWLVEKRSDLQNAADFFNSEAEKIRQKIIDKKSHNKLDTHQLTAGFINFCIEVVTNKQCNLNGFDLNKIELLVRTLDTYFKTLETSKMKIKDNDWFDFAILSYVQANDKYWTEDKRWINLITESGCEKYLYKVKTNRISLFFKKTFCE